MSNALFGGMFKAAGGKGITVGGDVPGLGESGGACTKLGLNVLKREVLIRIIPGPVPDADAKTIEVAKLMLGKI